MLLPLLEKRILPNLLLRLILCEISFTSYFLQHLLIHTLERHSRLCGDDEFVVDAP